MDCIFCKIANGEMPTEYLYEDEKVVAFKDLSPQAPVHFLVIPKEHIPSANEVKQENAEVIGHIYQVIAELAKKQGFDKDGYRVVNNCGNDGGQTVHHIHFHVMAGRQFQWPAG